MSETAKALKINRTTLLRLLHTLEAEGFVERRPGGTGYQVGLSLLEVGARAIFSQDLVQVAVPIPRGSRNTRSFRRSLGILDGTDVLYLVRRTPNTPLASNIRVGSRLPAHATTMGRMILAHMPSVEIERLYADKELERFSDYTATTLQEMKTKSAQDLYAGIAWSDAYFERGSVRPRWRCSISPARRSARSTSRARWAPSPTMSGVRSSVNSCARRNRDFAPARLDRRGASQSDQRQSTCNGLITSIWAWKAKLRLSPAVPRASACDRATPARRRHRCRDLRPR